MKVTIMLNIKALALTAALLVPAAAFAAPAVSYNESLAGKSYEEKITLTSATTPVLSESFSAYEAVYVVCYGSAASTSETLIFTDRSGRTVSTTTVNCSTTGAVVATQAGGGVAAAVRPSPTAGLTGVNTVTNIVIRKPTK